MGIYTNGFNQDKVIDALKSRLGWKQPTKTGSPTLNSNNTASESGRYYNDGSFHPVVTIDNLKETIEDAGIANDSFCTLLEDLQKAIALKTVTAVFNKPELIERTMLFERSLNNDQLITGSDQFVGVRFRLAKGNYAAQIKRISLFFNQAMTFQLYLYHEAKKDPLWTQLVTTVADDQTIVVPDIELILNSADFFKSGYFYLGYYQNSLDDVKAYSEQYCRSRSLCFDWDFFNANRSGDDFERGNVALPSTNYGINAEITVFRDHTDSIVNSAALFDNAMGLQMAYHVAKQILYAVRSNVNERILKDQMDKLGLQYEMDGAIAASDVPKSWGIVQRIDEEIKRLRTTFFPDLKNQTVNLAGCW
jgi:hypothetical protein